MALKTNLSRFILAIIFCIQFTPTLRAQKKLVSKEKSMHAMTIANKYFMDKWPDVGKRIVHERSRASNIWTRGVYYEGLMALYKLDKRSEYLDYAVRWADFHKWDLRDGETYTRNADNQCAGQTYIELYLLDPQPYKIEKIKASIDSMMRTPKIDDWNWIDAIQMAMPVFAQLGVIYNDPSYWERMHKMYMYTRNNHGDKGLFNSQDNLWWRDKDFDPPYKEPNGEDCYWARGNGWVLAALVRVLDILPKDAPHRKQYEDDLMVMADALLKVQRKDGFWNVSLHDAKNYGGKETTGTSLFVYGLAWGINNGYLKAKKYKSAATLAWNALVNDAIHDNGFLGYVQGTGKEPKDGQPVTYDSVPNFEDYGTGCFLLAGTEVIRMQGK
ncbi:glycoside hydrolase family 88/105 protein [Chryseosolibacter indicus]|uniref:Glycoside hydrolase family 88 protein n=1 Tax=Chryseosolibacter indicus TaxID=2782351 RepID=A0ABS5VVZ5_9BACT|nr:glycoside hydrolase family 88 protein [Chryseosolibacter indicus]MBT1705612.1 glycoside hydrolase family 88 protein [Chryseosolibacter indicus]